MTKKSIFIVGLLVIVLAFIIVATQQKQAPSSLETPLVSTPETSTMYTRADVALHKTQADCWTAVDGSVYDVSAWIAQHPGGAGTIISMCGTDGSAAFGGQHGGQRRPATELASFKIGTLK